MSVVGTLESLWRYPVKSMQGEELSEVFVTFGGVMGDRLHSLISASGNPGFPWYTARDQESLLLYKPHYKEVSITLQPKNLEAAQNMAPGINPLYPETAAFAVEVETPEGETYSLDNESFLEHLKALTDDQTLKLRFT